MKAKRFLSLTLSLALMGSLAAPAWAAEGAVYTPGTYTAKADGWAGKVTVTLTVDETSITAIQADGMETTVIGGVALEQLPREMMAAQSVEVDSVAGATVTSDAVKEAAAQALAEAMMTGTAPALPEEAPAEEPLTWRDVDYYTIRQQVKEEYTAAHLDEYAAFDADAWFAENWEYVTKEEYLSWCENGEEEFRQDMWAEYLDTQIEAQTWERYSTQLIALYEEAFPGELGSLSTAELLAKEGYQDPLTAYMTEYGLSTEEEARESLLRGYISDRQEAADRHDRVEVYRAIDPESWESFDADAYFAEEWSWYTKEEFMSGWRGLSTEEDFKEYLYLEYMDGQMGYDPYPWWEEDQPLTLVVNGWDYGAELTAADGVAYTDAQTLNAILGTDLAGEEPVAIRAAAQAAGWDVVWNQHCNEVVLLDREALIRGIYVPEEELETVQEDEDARTLMALLGQREGQLFLQDFSKFDEIMNRALAAGKVKEGQSYRTTETANFTLTAFNSLDGDKTYDFTLKADLLTRDNVMDLTLTVDAAQLLNLLGQPALDKLSAELPKFTFQNLKTLLKGCKAEVILDMEAGRLYWNVPLLALFDDTVSEDTWYAADLMGQVPGLEVKAMTSWSTGEVLYESLLSQMATNYWGAADAYSDHVMVRAGINLLVGGDTVTEKNGTLTWAFDARRLTELMEIIDPWNTTDVAGIFQELDFAISVDKNGRFDMAAAVRPDMDAIAAMATQDIWYGVEETALVNWILNLFDFRYAAQSSGTASRSTGSGEVHWKNQFKLEMESSSARTESREAPRTTPPAGVEIVEL